MNAVGAVVVAIFREMRRDRSAVVFLLLLPIGLMVLMGNIYESEDGRIPRLAILVTEADPAADAAIDVLRSGGGVELREVRDRTTLDDQVRRRRVDAGLVLAAGAPAELVGPPGVALPGGVRFVVRGAVSRAEQAAALAAEVPGPSIEQVLDGMPAPTRVPMAEPGEARTEAAIGVLVLMTFMNLIAYGSLVPSHRATGVLRRMGAAPVRRSTLLLAYGAGFAAIAMIQVVAAVVAGRLAVGVTWGPTWQVLVVSLGLVLAASGAAALAATLLPTPESGSSIGGPIGFVLGMLGGCLWPLDFVGGGLETVGGWVPHQWAVESLGAVADGTATVTALVAASAALALVGLACGAIGARRLRATWS